MYRRPGRGGEFEWKIGCPMFVGCAILSLVLTVIFYSAIAAAVVTVLCEVGNFPWC